METKRLSYFVRIAEDGSLTKASAALGIAQPALSRQIRLLEDDLGVSLFNRTARGMALTEDGERLRALVAGPLRELDLALQNYRSAATRMEGNFSIGMATSIADMLARPLALRMDHELPNIKLRMVEGPTGSLIDWLGRGIVDFALLEEAAFEYRVANRKLRVENVMLVGAAGASLKADRSMAFAEAARLPLILPSHHLGLRRVINDAATEARLALNIRLEADSSKLAKELVENGAGYAMLPLSYFKREHDQGRLSYCPVVQPDLPLCLFLAWRTYNDSNPTLYTLIENKIAATLADVL